MDQLDIAVQRTVRSSEKSAEELATLVGCSHQIFLNKINPNCDTNHLTLRDAVTLIVATRDPEILSTIAHLIGYRLEARDTAAGGDLLSAVLDNAAETGDIHEAIRRALEDGRVTPREKAEISREVTEARQSLDRLESVVHALDAG